MPEGQRKRQYYNELDKNPSRTDPESSEDGQNKKVNQDTASSNKPQDKWDKGLNKDGNSNERSQREEGNILLHEDLPLDAGEKDDHSQATPYLAPFEDGGHDRETVLYWDDWDRVIFKFE